MSWKLTFLLWAFNYIKTLLAKDYSQFKPIVGLLFFILSVISGVPLASASLIGLTGYIFGDFIALSVDVIIGVLALVILKFLSVYEP